MSGYWISLIVLGDVGVGGLLLGGGLSFLSAQYGFACDNVVNYEIVLANSTIVNANAENNTDLFWALKGGGNQFGKASIKSIPDSTADTVEELSLNSRSRLFQWDWLSFKIPMPMHI